MEKKEFVKYLLDNNFSKNKNTDKEEYLRIDQKFTRVGRNIGLTSVSTWLFRFRRTNILCRVTDKYNGYSFRNQVVIPNWSARQCKDAKELEELVSEGLKSNL